MPASTLGPQLLQWYDSHARVLPWRVSPRERAAGRAPQPYHVWLSEIMLQQTTVQAVIPYFTRFVQRWPTVQALAAAEDGDLMAAWAGLGYYARARNLLKCARTVAEKHRGRFPESRAELLDLPGIGPYTAAAIAAIAFDQPETVVDGNVERVVARLWNIRTPLPRAKPELAARAATLTPRHRPGDHAQAMMDLGATICVPKTPRCAACPLSGGCLARRAGTAATLPARERKAPKPTRHGIAYIARRADGAWLLERRPQSGLLGGMLGWPGSEWADTPRPAPPLPAAWQPLPAEVRHTFTHFNLSLSVHIARVPNHARPSRGTFLPETHFNPADLPTVMRKAHALAASHLR